MQISVVATPKVLFLLLAINQIPLTEGINISSTDLKKGYTRLYSKIVLEDWRFKVSNELWKNEIFLYMDLVC